MHYIMRGLSAHTGQQGVIVCDGVGTRLCEGVLDKAIALGMEMLCIQDKGGTRVNRARAAMCTRYPVRTGVRTVVQIVLTYSYAT